MRKLAILLALFFCGPALAQSVDLPPAMLGTWAPEATDCVDREGEVIDSRMLVGPLVVERFAAIFTVSEWRREGDAYRAQAQVAEEGEEEPGPDPIAIELRLGAEGQLLLKIDEDEPQAFLRCPDGVSVR
jgi:hypothetical protein